MDQILSHQHTRKLSKNLTCQFRGRTYQITDHGNGYRLRGAAITVCAAFDGSITVRREGQLLPHRLLIGGQPPIPLDDDKAIQDRINQAKEEQQTRRTHKPPTNHRWRKRYKPASTVAS